MALSLTFTKIEALDTRPLENLKYLSIQGTLITVIDTSLLNLLEELYAQNSKLESL